MEKERLDYLDMVKGIGIIMVVAGHSGYLEEHVLTVIASFHMPLFFIISGMLLYHTKEETRPMKQIIVKKLRTLLLPYAVFSVIYLWNYGFDFYLVEGYPFIVQAICLDGISVLWFLTALFFAEILWHAVRKCCGRAALFVLAVMAAAVVCLAPRFVSVMTGNSMLMNGVFGLLKALLRGVIGAGFLTVGYVVMRIFKQLPSQMNLKLRMGEICTGILFLLLTIYFSLKNGRTDMHYLVFNNPAIYLFCACAGTFGLVFIFCALPRIGALRYLGKNTLTIMATHLDCQYMWRAIWLGQFLAAHSPRGKMYCLYFGIALGMTMLELPTIYLINRFCPFLVGKAPLPDRKRLIFDRKKGKD